MRQWLLRYVRQSEKKLCTFVLYDLYPPHSSCVQTSSISNTQVGVQAPAEPKNLEAEDLHDVLMHHILPLLRARELSMLTCVRQQLRWALRQAPSYLWTRAAQAV